MTFYPIRRTVFVLLAAGHLLTPAARAHFLWLTIEPGADSCAKARAFFNEAPEPDATFLKYVRNVKLSVDGQTLPSQVTADSREGLWSGRAPVRVDSELDLGVTARGAKTFRLIYTARAQSEPVAEKNAEGAKGLRVRVISGDLKDRVEVLFDGKPVAGARIKVYSEAGEPRELKADEAGRATVDGISEGKASMWATRADATPGTLDGKPYAETRHYATLTYSARPQGSATAQAAMPEPATSLGAAVLGNWLYVYGGHLGKVHHYDLTTTSKHFRRLNLIDGKTWEELPMGPDLQGLPLVTDGKALYRTGGMSAKNKPGDEEDMHSVATVARFDADSKQWSDLPPMPDPRSTHDAAIIGRTLYVVGGWSMRGASEESEFLDHALSIDLDHPESGWKTIKQPFKRRALAAAAHSGKLYVLGGLVGGGMNVERRVDIYDPATGNWSRGPDLPSATKVEGFGSSAYELDGRLYISGASGKIHRLTEAGDAWEAVGAWSHPRIAHRLLAGPDHSIVAVGGSSGGKPTAVIETVRFAPPAVKAEQHANAGN